MIEPTGPPLIWVRVEIPILDSQSNSVRCYSASEPRRLGRPVERSVRRCLKRILKDVLNDAKAVSMDCQNAIKTLQ